MNSAIPKMRKLSGVRRLATAADIFAGTVHSKNVAKKRELPPPSYGGRYIVSMLPGIGSGPQMMKYVKDVFESAHVPVDFEEIPMGSEEDDRAALLSINRNGVAIKGHIPRLADTSSNVTLRSHLDLYVYLVHVQSYPSIPCRFPGLDIVVFRQNTEGEYAMLEHQSKAGVVESLKIITRENTERFARWALDYVRKEGRRKITIVHKANIMKLSDGLFLRTVNDIAASEYPEVEVNDMIVDNCCMQIVSNPKAFDVIITPNLYGNIITNIICGLIGGPGLIAGQNYGDYSAVFEVGSRHISFEDKRYVNPIAMLNASIDMLYYLNKDNHADLIRDAVYKTLVYDQIHTPDIGGSHTGSDMVESIKDNIREQIKSSDIAAF